MSRLFLFHSLSTRPWIPVSLLLTTLAALHRPHLLLEADVPKASSSTSTLSGFPTLIDRPSKPPLTLVSTGIRTVTMFRIKVYEVGLYADLSTPVPLEMGKELTAAERMQELLQGRDCMLRIVPTRNTSFTHMRDGFVRALQHRLTLSSSPPSEATKTALGAVLTIFPTAPLPKSTALDILYTAPTQPAKSFLSRTAKSAGTGASLLITHEGRKLGEVKDDWVAREWVLAYFDEKREISPQLRQGVQARFNEMAMDKSLRLGVPY